MAFSLNYPLLLALIPVLAAFVLFTAKRLKGLPKWRRRTVVSIRTVVFVLIVLCLTGFGIKKISDNTTTVFVVDSSDSATKSKKAAEDFMKEALKKKKSTDKVSIVSFGANSLAEFAPTRDLNFSSLQTQVNGTFTNIEQALKYAGSLIPAGDRKRIVLISDGEENVGDAIKGGKVLKEQGINLEILPIKNDAQSEVQIKDIKVPETLRLNEKFEILIKINSSVKTKARLKLYRERELTSETQVEIQQGENNFVFSDTAQKGGVLTYSAEIEPEADSLSQNNRMSTFSYIEDIAKILVIHDRDEAGGELARILESESKVDVSKPDNLPVALEEIQKYDGFVVANVSADRFDDRFLDNLEKCVKHMGKGLLVTGGADSYALGGYYKTVLETVLPVNMNIKSKEEDPNLALALVIDKSGSMTSGQYGVSKLELAKEAAIRATEVLKNDDMVGVVAFDDAAQWVVKFQKLNDLKKIQEDIGSIRPGGGTQIIGPLEEAYLAIKDADTKLKHIILLTDGQAEKTGYERLVKDINDAGITLSTVAVGSGADTMLLKALAYGGGGRYYSTDEFSDIPKIFAKETFLAGKKYINDKTFTPLLSSYSPILNEISAVPELDGYVRTTPKGTSRVIFSSDENDPVLATWQYGLGRTAAWTSDAKGMWTSKWMSWNQSPKFWKNIMSWLVQKKVKDDYSVSGSFSEGKGKLELRLPSDERLEDESVEAVIVGPSGKEEKTSMQPVSPGVYRGDFSGDETGVYIANINVNSKGETVKNINSGVVIPYSPEYDVTRKNSEDLLQRLAYESGGRLIDSSDDVFSGKLLPTVSINDVTNTLLILIIILLMIDITIRRLDIPFGKIELLFNRIGDKGAKVASSMVRPVAERVRTQNRIRPSHKENNANKEVESNIKPSEQPKVKEQNKEALEKNVEQGSPDVAKTDSHISKLLEKKRKREG